MPFPAARITDMHVCPMVTGVVPHVGGPIVGPVPTVIICMMPAAHVGSACVCVGPPDTIVMGSTTVITGGTPQARMLDQCAHGGVIVSGAPTVIVGP
ncbi:MAG: PAAR domain-containing protein [Gammaproteobacteria bacterium]